MSSRLPPAGRQWLPVAAHIPYRFLVTYRAPQERLGALVPAPLELDVRAGFGFISVCALRLEGLAPTAVPRSWAFDTPEFLVRVAVRHRGQPSFLTLASWVASRPLVWLSSRFSHYRPEWADFEERVSGEEYFLRATAPGGCVSELDVVLPGAAHGSAPLAWPKGSAFSGVSDAEDFLLGMAGSIDVTPAQKVRFQPITHGAWRARLGRVRHARFDFIERLAASAELDHVLGMTNIQQRWEVTTSW